MKRLLLAGLLPLSCRTGGECFTDTGTTLTIHLTSPDAHIYRLVYTIHPTPPHQY